MEDRKKGAKELLEERQMKRYFRSKKRSKGKSKKESNKVYDVISKESSHSNQISIPTVKEQIGEVQNMDKMIKISPESNNESPQDDSQQGRVKDDSTEDLSDWEIIEHLGDKITWNIDQETPSDVMHGIECEMHCIKDDLVETIDKNKAWVEGKNKVNDLISSAHRMSSEMISIPTNTSMGGGQSEKIEDAGNKLTKKEHIQEFSPIVYWRDPIPDIADLALDNIRKEEFNFFQNDAPEISNTEAKENMKTFKNVSLDEGNKSKKKEGKLNAKDTDNFSSLGYDSHMWFDKSKYDNAEVKYYGDLERIGKLTKYANTIQAKKSPEETEIKDDPKKEVEEKLSLEGQLKSLESENIEYKQSLTRLSKVVRKLEERVTNLENRSLSSSMTDEGVDMTGERKCAFFDDCLCKYDDEEARIGLDNISMDDGSEFEEFNATNTLDNCKDTLWQDDLEDISGQDLAAELRRNCRTNKD